MNKPDFIKNCNELSSNKSFSYPGDNETFGAGASLSSKLGLKNLAINYEVLQPGNRSSWPHAHSTEDEFILILSGSPQIWIDGNIHKLSIGDCVALPAGGGFAHTLINNSESVVTALVVGEPNVPEDKVFYPLHPKRNEECKKEDFFWKGHPEHELGPHDGRPDKQRP